VLWGGASHSAVQRANVVLGERLRGATLGTIEGAAHFMIATHANEVAGLIALHVRRAEAKIQDIRVTSSTPCTVSD
jgi:hypothetical protein